MNWVAESLKAQRRLVTTAHHEGPPPPAPTPGPDHSGVEMVGGQGAALARYSDRRGEEEEAALLSHAHPVSDAPDTTTETPGTTITAPSAAGTSDTAPVASLHPAHPVGAMSFGRGLSAIQHAWAGPGVHVAGVGVGPLLAAGMHRPEGAPPLPYNTSQSSGMDLIDLASQSLRGVDSHATLSGASSAQVEMRGAEEGGQGR